MAVYIKMISGASWSELNCKDSENNLKNQDYAPSKIRIMHLKGQFSLIERCIWETRDNNIFCHILRDVCVVRMVCLGSVRSTPTSAGTTTIVYTMIPCPGMAGSAWGPRGFGPTASKS